MSCVLDKAPRGPVFVRSSRLAIHHCFCRGFLLLMRWVTIGVSVCRRELGRISMSFSGVYRATVTDTDDPLGRVMVPEVSDAPMWATVCLPSSAAELPSAGSSVWVSFEGRYSLDPAPSLSRGNFRC